MNRSNELVVNFYIDDKLKTTLTEQAGRTTIKNHTRREKDVIFPSINKIEGFTRYTIETMVQFFKQKILKPQILTKYHQHKCMLPMEN